MSDKQLVVGIADMMKICRGPGKLITYALGSCIGICFYDPMIRLGEWFILCYQIIWKEIIVMCFKYADTGIPATLRKLEVFGGVQCTYGL